METHSLTTNSGYSLSGSSRLAMHSASAGFFHIVAIFIVALYISNVHGYFYSHGEPVKLLYYQLVVIGLAGIALIVRSAFILPKLPLALVIWIGLFLALIFTSFLLSAQTDASIIQMILGLKSPALLLAFTILLIPESNSKSIQYVLLFAVFLAVGLHIYDFQVPTFSSTPGRAGGFHQNSNASGKVLAIAMVLSCAVLEKRWRLAFCLLAGAGVVLTFSRSALFLWVIGIIGLAATGHFSDRSRSLAVTVFGCLALLMVIAVYSGLMLKVFQAAGLDQFLTRATMSRLGGEASALQDPSAIGRINAIWLSLDEFQKHPWFGSGLGATTEWITMRRPHNLYLMLMVETGAIGLLVFLAFIAFLWTNSNPTGRIAVVMYSVSSFFSHTNFEHAATLCLLAIIIAIYAKDNRRIGLPEHSANKHFGRAAA